VPGDLLDLLLLVLAAAFAVAGYRQGFIIGVLSLAGFAVGGLLGATVAPKFATAVASSQNLQAFTAIVVVFGAAVVGMLLASGLGVAVRSRLRARPITVLDSIGGAVVNVIAVLGVAWLVGSLVAQAPFPAVARQVQDSLVLRTVNRFIPQSVAFLPGFPPLRSLIASGAYTQVFSAFGDEGALSLKPPDRAVLTAPGLSRAEPSIVKVEGVAPSCSRQIEGSGFVIAPDRVLTNAHVVAGVTKGPYVTTVGGQVLRATVVLYDPNRDVAVLSVPGLRARPLRFAGTAAYGASAIVVGYPEDHDLTTDAARVATAERVTGPNIYQTSDVTRWIYPIRALVRRGNSGGPLLTPGGQVYGVVFAAAVSVSDTGYALTAAEVSGDASAGARATRPVSTQGCEGS
jgi:S1-C subfamily serine protease